MKTMRLSDRLITDRETLCAILDRLDAVALGLVDDGEPYTVPVNFGYDFTDEKLTFYIHCASEGSKVDMLAAHPRVCVTGWLFHKLSGNTGHFMHTYASVMAFGTARRIDPDTESENWIRAHERLIDCSGFHGRMTLSGPAHHFDMYRIDCDRSEVFGKSQHPLRGAEQVKKIYDDGNEEDFGF